ncbi:tRNA(fMet)-specific endonuclease VapC [Filimonas lacunae]|uniref:Ribonuclease VapC n=1 Tax=Filimonas lacunae TaxID=477680 RepID=A0A1N7R7W3_9BACT|nr:type II toxin-antitoxin system VapC family toxin [Filimonas lacunae]SIT31203.1 tRNA(fMet)-specific endonuclease VapC [Filimonas lacunae]
MIGNRFALDTNIVSAWLKGEEGVADKIDNAEVYVPIVVIGELYYGAAYSLHVQKNIKDVQQITRNYELLLIDEDTTILYGDIKSTLRRKGKPIPENDIWIAAISQRYNITLVTRDNHFSEIDGLKLAQW